MDTPEAEHNQPRPEEIKRDTINVKVSTPLFLYIANGLAPVYQKELAALREDGSFEKIKNFHEGTFGMLMGQILDKQTAQQEFEQPEVTLDLSDQDMKVLDEKLRGPKDATGGVLALEMKMMGELKGKYSEAKMSHRTAAIVEKVKSLFKR